MIKIEAKIAVLLLFTLIFGGCRLFGESKNGQKDPRSVRVVKSVDNKCSIETPRTWFSKTNLHPDAKLQAADVGANRYAIVISEGKRNFTKGENLDEYTKRLQQAPHDKIIGYEASDVESLKIGGYAARRFEVTGAINKTRVKWIFTTVDAPKNFHQIVLWTTEEKYEESEKIFEDILDSFKETEGEIPDDESEAAEKKPAANGTN